ncbi:hypothetical protein [Burkholderia cepacia]|uniref:hypothetical protein n=1 Tax=Burkholderia cepacia TaxID=292 RepID=UPI0012D86621|nr:hypothetical protein [Burkholderia cepacia]
MVSPWIIGQIDPTGAPLDAGQIAAVAAIATVAGGGLAGALGRNITGGITAAQNEALNNSVKDPQESRNQIPLGDGVGGGPGLGGGGAGVNPFASIGESAGEAVASLEAEAAGLGNSIRQEISDFTSRYLSGSGGRWGTTSTRQLNYDIGQQLSNDGYRVTGGGGVVPEEYIPGGGPGTRGGTFVDITAEPANGSGPTIRVQTVTTKADGVTPTSSETAAAIRIQNARTGDTLIMIPKGATPAQINDAIKKVIGR